MKQVFLFSAAVCSFLISSELSERDELSCVPLSQDSPAPSSPTLWWSSMNSPYCCLMEMGSQTNEQPSPGSAPQLLINPDAEVLMALISSARVLFVLQNRICWAKITTLQVKCTVFMSHLVCLTCLVGNHAALTKNYKEKKRCICLKNPLDKEQSLCWKYTLHNLDSK